MKEQTFIDNKGFDIKTALRKWGPWLVTVVIFYFVFQRVPVEKVVDAALHANLKIFLPILLTCLIFQFFWDVLAYTLLFRWFDTDVSYTDMIPIRGASYILIALNFFVGQGGLALLMNRWKGLSIKRTSSIILFTIFNDYFLLLAFCLVGAFQIPGVDLADFFMPGDKGDLVRFVVISWLYFWMHIGFYRWYLPRTKRLQRFKQSVFFSSFHEAPTARYFKLGAVKSVNFFVGIFAYYFAFPAFGLHVPLLYLVTFIPIVWLIGSIPITIMGFGTVQAAMIWLVAGYAQGSGSPQEIEAAVLALSLLWSFSFRLGNLAAGAICVSRLPKRIWMPAELVRQDTQTSAN
jgi:uncharacterized membrane protein YbhN (UPF0104 family)